MAKIAVALDQALARRAADGTRGQAAPRIVAHGDGWTVADVICTSGPEDHPFEEQHAHYAIAVVVAGTFQYRSTLGGGVMTPGSVMLGNPGQCYECGHEHGRGDRCVAFWYAPDYFERLTSDIRAQSGSIDFRRPGLPALRRLSPLIARAAEGAMGSRDLAWEELAVAVAGQVARAAVESDRGHPPAPSQAVARVTNVVRTIERHPDSRLTLSELAGHAGLSPYHFLRTFERLIGVTPHQFILRARLRDAALRLASDTASVLDIALDCGFGDVSNFNRAFRAEFGMTPSAYRLRPRRMSRGPHFQGRVSRG